MMRSLWLLAVAFVCFSSRVASARSKPTAISRTSGSMQAKPLSPAQLKGKVVYVLGRDVWAVDPTSQRKFLLYKNLFFPADKSLENTSEIYGADVRFSRADIAWSLDLSQIAFTRRNPRFQGSELFVMNWNGSGKRQLTNDKYSIINSSPRWSPDGKTLLFNQNSPYRMGGPGYDSEGIGMLTVEKNSSPSGIVPPIFALRLTAGNEGGGSVNSPFWSRDGRKVLLSFRKFNGDYNGESSHQVVSLDDGKMTLFANNWNDFLLENQSRSGQWRIQHFVGNRPYWELYRPDKVEAQGIIWQEDRGFEATRFCVSDDGRDFVFAGNFSNWKINSAGLASADTFFGLWFLHHDSNGGAFPKLLVEKAELVGWF